MENLFGSNYETVGSTESDLLLKTRGKVKIQIGNQYIDLTDGSESVEATGNVNSSASTLSMVSTLSSSVQKLQNSMSTLSSAQTFNASSTGLNVYQIDYIPTSTNYPDNDGIYIYNDELYLVINSNVFKLNTSKL